MPLDAFLLVLRLLFIVLIYLFLVQVVVAITRDLRQTATGNTVSNNTSAASLGQLIVVDSGPSAIQPGTRFNLERQTYIGRGPTNTIQIPDSFVSSEHTHIWFEHGKWFVQDAGSTNGTFVNNQPAYNPIETKPGDIVRVGFLQFKFTQ